MKSATTEVRLVDRLRDVNEPNALIVRRRAADELERLRERLEEVKRLASDPFASEAVALRACLLTAYEGLGLPGPEPSPERDIAKAILTEWREAQEADHAD